MFTLFPEVLYLAPLSAFMIRAALAALFSVAAYTHYRGIQFPSGYMVVAVEALAALSLALGYYAQLGALIGFFTVGSWFIVGPLRPYSKSTAVLALVMCLSVFVTGAGAFAFDLPL